MPTKLALPSSCFAAATTSGASATHGPHQEPHTTTTAGLPRRAAMSSALPSRSLPDSSTGDARSTAFTAWTVPSPLTNPVSPVPSSEEQPDRSRAAQANAPRVLRMSGPLLLGRVPRGERRVAVLDRDQVARGLGVGHLRDAVVGEVQRRQRAERALALARVDVLAALLDVQAGRPDRQLVGHDHGLVA